MESEKILIRDQLDCIQAQHKTKNQLKKAIDLEYTKISKNKDKKNYSTVQEVFDPRTLKNLNKFYINEIIQKLDSEIISSGKEANVYYTKSFDGQKEYAVKIYKTMVMAFKDREEYISGEFRFRDKGKSKRTNPHKLIAAWAEKEIRNLKRISQIGIKVPQPIQLKENILVMEFIGKDKIAAPRLRDAKLCQEQLSKYYIEILELIRNLYINARLVHGDLSEFNILYFEKQLILIDVSQSMEINHPLAIEFLKRDIYNINNYFKEQNVIVFSLRQIFRFVTNKNLNDEQQKQQIDDMIEQAIDLNYNQDKKEFESFMDINIPKSLFELDLLDIERLIDEKNKMKKQGLIEEMPIYSQLTGMIDLNQQNNQIDDQLEQIENQNEIEQKKEKINQKLSKSVKKQNKKQIKEQNKIRRQEKMSKKQKKKLVKKTKRRKQLIIKKNKIFYIFL